jgi:hypothetical protein
VPAWHRPGRCLRDLRRPVPGDPLQADHIVAVADGGGDELANLRAIHRSEHAHRAGQQGAQRQQIGGFTTSSGESSPTGAGPRMRRHNANESRSTSRPEGTREALGLAPFDHGARRRQD